MIGTADYSSLIQLYKFRRQKYPQKGTDSTIWFIKFTKFKFMGIIGYVKIDLFVAIDWINSLIIIGFKFPILYIEKDLYIFNRYIFLKDD